MIMNVPHNICLVFLSITLVRSNYRPNITPNVHDLAVKFPKFSGVDSARSAAGWSIKIQDKRQICSFS